jgi:6-methylsalicylate decarboxylase
VPNVDLHQHLWPEPFVAALRARREPPLIGAGHMLVTPEGSFHIEDAANDPEARIAKLDRDEIHVGVLSLQPTLGLDRLTGDERRELEGTWAEGIAGLVASSGGRFLALAPDTPREGFAGVVVGASALVDLERSAPLLDIAAERDTLVFVHPEAGNPPSAGRPEWWEWIAGYPAQMSEAYLSWLAEGRERWPTLRVVFAMLAGGGPFQLERLSLRGADVRSAIDPNTYFDVSTHGRRAIELCIETFGVGQLVYGSDTPVVDSGPTLDAVRGFGDAVVHVLQSDTPNRLLLT